MKGRPLALFLGGFALSMAAERWLPGSAQHGEFWWSPFYGFFSLFGFAGCLAIVLLAKFVLGPWLQRKETYYERRKET